MSGIEVQRLNIDTASCEAPAQPKNRCKAFLADPFDETRAKRRSARGHRVVRKTKRPDFWGLTIFINSKFKKQEAIVKALREQSG